MNKLLISLTIIFILCLYFCLPGNSNKPPISSGSEMVLEGEFAHHDYRIGVKIDRYLSAMEVLGFSGAIIVSEGDKVILRKGYGFAERSSRHPYMPNTIQSHGSITKQMTAAAILLLESRGFVSVEDTITKHFDKVSKDKKEITIHQLLTHSSGLPGGIGPDDEPIEAQEYIDRAMAAPLQFCPGSGYGYSNTGYALLGIIVERISGQTYETFLHKELFLPAGLTESGYVLPEWDRDELAVGYRKGKRWGTVYKRGWLEEGPGWNLRANGGLHTTVDDMYLWYKNIIRGQSVLSDETIKRWTTGYVTESNGLSKYAYGWVVYDTKWGPIVAHSGSNGIFSADFVWLPERDLFFYIQGNTSIIPARGQRNQILAAAFDPDFPMPPMVVPNDSTSSEDAQKRIGTYFLDGGLLELTADDTRLIAKLSGQSVLDLILKPSEKQRKRFAELNQRTIDAMEKLKAGEDDALKDIIDEGENAIAHTRILRNRISQFGNLQSLNLIGSFENIPGSSLAEFGPWTTFVHAEFDNWNQYWNIVWDNNGTYQGTYSGPWPTFILIPTAEGNYRGVRQGYPWDMIEIHFKGDCLVIDKLLACPEK